MPWPGLSRRPMPPSPALGPMAAGPIALRACRAAGQRPARCTLAVPATGPRAVAVGTRNRRPPTGHGECCRRRCRRPRAFPARCGAVRRDRGPRPLPRCRGRSYRCRAARRLCPRSHAGIAADVAARRAAAGGAPYGDLLADVERTGLSTGIGCRAASPGEAWRSRRFSRRREDPGPSRTGSAATWPPGWHWDRNRRLRFAMRSPAGPAPTAATVLAEVGPGGPGADSRGVLGRVALDRRLGLAATVDRAPPRGQERRSAAEILGAAEAIVGPSGAREVSDFSTGTVETASNRLGGELPGAAGDWAGRPASGMTVEGSGRTVAIGSLQRAALLRNPVGRFRARRALEVCGGACEGSRATISGAGSDSPGWTSTRAILRRRGGALFRRRRLRWPRAAQSILFDFAARGGLGRLGRFLGGLGHGDGSGRSRSWEAAARRPFAGPWPGPRAAWLLRSWRRPAGGCPTARRVRGRAHAKGRDLDIGHARDFGRGHGTLHIARLQLGGGGACSRMVVATAFSKACSGCCSSSWAQW